jgi:membrane-bound inhibitor of C-type lysozyme
MVKKSLITVLVAVSVMVGITSLWGADGQPVVTYVCSSGEELLAIFDLKTDSITLKLPDGSSHRLPRALSASGARYANDRMVFWEHQGEASLWLNDKLIFKGREPGKGGAGQDDPLYTSMDADNNGVVSLDEFINAPLALLKTKDGQKLVPIATEGATTLNVIEKQNLFKEIDQDRNGYIDRKEWIIFKDGKFFPKK